MKRSLFILLTILTLLCLGFASGCNAEATQTEATEAAGPYQFRSDELEKYVIVYDSDAPGYYKLALKLKNRISAEYGKSLSTERDTDLQPSKYEILIGDTNRCDSQGRIMEYSVTVNEGKFIINSGGAFSTEEAVSFLCEKVFNGQELKLDNGEYYKKSFLTKHRDITNGATARIMSANLLSDKFSDSSYKSASYRAEIFAGMLLSYTPDVIGLQEADESWISALEDYLPKLREAYGLTYSMHLASFENKVNYTSLLYRTDNLKIEECGVKVFTWWKNSAFSHRYHMRNVGWARLSHVDAPEKSFIVANTHWSYRTEHADGGTYLSGAETPIAVNQLRLQCKDETNEFLSALIQSPPDIPVFLTGDFNTSLPFFTQWEWTPGGFGIISEEAKANGTALSTVPVSGHFDHIFGAGDYSVKRYEFFKDTNQQDLLTDHPFVYADLSF